MLERKKIAYLAKIQQIADERGIELFLVGGFVRDLLRGDSMHDRDIDLLVAGDAGAFAKAVQSCLGGVIKEFPDFLTAKIVDPVLKGAIEELDFASARSERYPKPGALPCVDLATVKEDLARRDFSINAIALPLNLFLASSPSINLDIITLRQKCLDPYHGCEDLDNRLIRILHEKSFIDDPTRLYRALRYQVRIGGSLEDKTQTYFTQALSEGCLQHISMRRRVNEVVKLLREPSAFEVISLAQSCGLLEAAFAPYLVSQLPSGWCSMVLALSRLSEEVRIQHERYLEDSLITAIKGVIDRGAQDDFFNALSYSKARRKQVYADYEAISKGNFQSSGSPVEALLGAALS